MSTDKKEKGFSRIWLYDNGVRCICDRTINGDRNCIYLNDSQKIGYNNCHNPNILNCNFLKYEISKEQMWNNP